MPSGRHPTIHDVAARAGVSKSLVSLVMRDAPQVSDERRRAVLRAASELGYRPNAVARSLVRNRSNVLGVVLSDLHNPFFVEVVDGIEEEAIASRHRALFNTGSRSPGREAEALETLLQLRVDGVILAGTVLPPRAIVAAAENAPVTLVARPSRWPAIDSVTNDDRAGAALVVDHLVSLGHRRIAHVDGGRGAGAADRRNGFLARMRRHGLTTDAVVAPGAFTEDGGAAGTEDLLKRRKRPTAVFVANDLAAVGALRVLRDRGLEVPGDVSVVGYDNVSIAGLDHVDLTTIDQPRREMGAEAVRLLLERLDGGRRQSRHVVIPPALVVRGSTGPPPGRRWALTRTSVRPEPGSRSEVRYPDHDQGVSVGPFGFRRMRGRRMTGEAVRADSPFELLERVRSPELEAEGRVRYLVVNGRQDDGVWGPVGAVWLSEDGKRGGFLVHPWALWEGSEFVRGYRSALERGWSADLIYGYWLREVWRGTYSVETERDAETLLLVDEVVASL